MAKPTKTELAQEVAVLRKRVSELEEDLIARDAAEYSDPDPGDDDSELDTFVFGDDHKPFLVAFLNQARDSAENRWHAVALERLADLVERMP